ncbi:MAG: transglutaminase family protein [Nibricoccus sp.]
MKLHVLHRTRFVYRTPVRDSLNEVRLQPIETATQRLESFSLKITPHAPTMHQLDFYQNHVHRFDVLPPHTSLEVEATSVVINSRPPNPLDGPAVALDAMNRCMDRADCYDFMQPSTYITLDADVTAVATKITLGCKDTWTAVLALLRFIHDEFHYQPAVTNVHTKMSEALRLRQGVCQDFAHVLIGLCRSLKIPARYVSGYLYNGPADQLKGAQASHAWLEVFIPGHDWIGIDPTNHMQTSERHVRIASGRDYADVSPIRGTYRGTGDRTLHVDVLVTRLDSPAGLQSQSQTHSQTASYSSNSSAAR